MGVDSRSLGRTNPLTYWIAYRRATRRGVARVGQTNEWREKYAKEARLDVRGARSGEGAGPVMSDPGEAGLFSLEKLGVFVCSSIS